MFKFNKVREGMYNLGEIKRGNITTILICNFTNGELVFNNANNGNGGTWAEHIKISDITKETIKEPDKFNNEKWYKRWKDFIASGVATKDFNCMVEKMNQGLIN